jgi:electron-transferring-flavoprotein dehydrogenase
MTPQEILAQFGPRETMEYDVVIVGAGPAGLATAIRLKQLDPGLSVVVLEKGSEPGAHILSGAVMDPRAITELLPDWKSLGAPLNQPVTADEVLFLGAHDAKRLPAWMIPGCLRNDGNYVISLGNVTRWLGEQAEALGVEIYPGFAGSEVLFNDDGSVKGVATGNMGVGRDGEPTDNFQPGMELHAKYTLFAEGARGHLGKQLIARGSITAPERMCAPISDAFSMTHTPISLPRSAASCFRRIAADRPAGPPPTTTTSYSIESR